MNMQNAGAGGGYSGGGNQFHGYHQSSPHGVGAKPAEGDGDLPSSLPSYMPSTGTQLPFGYDVLGRGPPGSSLVKSNGDGAAGRGSSGSTSG